MKSLPRAGVLSSAQRQQEIKRLAQQETKKYFLDQQKRIIAATLYTMHLHFGWGKKRLMRLFNLSNELAREIEERYQAYGEAEEVMYIKLREIGIDLDELLR